MEISGFRTLHSLPLIEDVNESNKSSSQVESFLSTLSMYVFEEDIFITVLLY